ncbi:unnamed protein product [Protopolystoma xenopodis]|uniref:Uncharacterized protein n=1 Tax=Protopolystoma xenopodis TaxID=117903 RepID=A0A448WGF4_9PLAT|nr:unnamed protein product [Protopolystoma xenopodis]
MLYLISYPDLNRQYQDSHLLTLPASSKSDSSFGPSLSQPHLLPDSKSRISKPSSQVGSSIVDRTSAEVRALPARTSSSQSFGFSDQSIASVSSFSPPNDPSTCRQQPESPTSCSIKAKAEADSELTLNMASINLNDLRNLKPKTTADNASYLLAVGCPKVAFFLPYLF